MEDHHKSTVITVVTAFVLMASIGVVFTRFQPGITGASTTDLAIACYSNSQCNDNVACTIDSCKNSGQSISFCSNRPIDFCKNDDGCCPAGCEKINDNDCA